MSIASQPAMPDVLGMDVHVATRAVCLCGLHAELVWALFVNAYLFQCALCILLIHRCDAGTMLAFCLQAGPADERSTEQKRALDLALSHDAISSVQMGG